MKRFRFALRPVSVLRTHADQRARETFAAAVRAYAAAEEELARSREGVTRFETALFDRRRGRYCAADEAIALAAYRRECVAEMAAEKVVFTARAEMFRCRTSCIEAHRQLDVVHRLEASARSAHRVAMARAEQAELDDLGGCRASRRRIFPT